MRDWEDAWLNGRTMPPHKFSSELQSIALDIADGWCRRVEFRTCLEQAIARMESGGTLKLVQSGMPLDQWQIRKSKFLLAHLFYNGFKLRGETSAKLVPPIPVLVKLRYSEPLPAN